MRNSRFPRTLDLPVFPWDFLTPYRVKATACEGGAVDLSIGTPVDDCPPPALAGLSQAANSPGYPPVAGSDLLRNAICSWARTRNIRCIDEDSCLPTVGSKELVASLGWQLGLSSADTVLFPDVAYPTYDICARLAGAKGIAVSSDISTWPRDAALVWINSPANPTGWVASKDWLRQVVSWARQVGAIVASDECYAELTGWASLRTQSWTRTCVGALARICYWFIRYRRNLIWQDTVRLLWQETDTWFRLYFQCANIWGK